MGLCKCPKKKVTNLFCFEHRVNVCEHCLVSNHPKCIVQSYLQWLKDSDYDPTCRLCGKKLADEDGGECVRLVCYDVFHWPCLDHYARQLPANTAPAGYCCPICNSGIFPGNNVVSPVADSLREKLTKVNWARTGLGMPLIDETPPPPKPQTNTGAATQITGPQDIPETHTHANNTTSASTGVGPISDALNAGYSIPPSGTPTPGYKTATASSGVQDSVISMDAAAPYTRSDFLSGHPADPRKLFDSTKGDLLNMSHDHDEDKYKRRPAMQWFARWFNSRTPKQRREPKSSSKRVLVIILIALIAFFTVIVIFSKLGRASADHDPLLDPLANPNIKVNE